MPCRHGFRRGKCTPRLVVAILRGILDPPSRWRAKVNVVAASGAISACAGGARITLSASVMRISVTPQFLVDHITEIAMKLCYTIVFFGLVVDVSFSFGSIGQAGRNLRSLHDLRQGHWPSAFGAPAVWECRRHLRVISRLQSPRLELHQQLSWSSLEPLVLSFGASQGEISWN